MTEGHIAVEELVRELRLIEADPIDLQTMRRACLALTVLEAQNKVLMEAVEIIAGEKPCADNLMGNVDIAINALRRIHGDSHD